MRTCHFVYAGSPDNSEERSPYTITRNLYRFLRTKFDHINYYDWCHTGSIAEVKEDDIVLGHPNYPANSATRQLFNSKARYKAIIHPLHTNYVDDNMPFNDLAMKADDIFSIQGPYWYNTIDQTPFAHWKPKITRLDIPVCSQSWKHAKNSFNPIGKRGIVYVGSSIPNKNLGLLVQIASIMKDVNFEWYGGSSDHELYRLRNVKVIGWVNIRGYIDKICENNDFIISTSISDANPTTLSEVGLASGLIPICTKESGYVENDNFTNIPLDANGAVAILRKWLNKPSDELAEISARNRRLCEEQFTWEVFCDKIWAKISRFM